MSTKRETPLTPVPNADALYEAAWLADRNAADFMRDAEVLLKSGSSAHAVGMVVLAEEEFAKSLVLSGCACGWLTHPNWLKLVMRDHGFKHVAEMGTVGWYALLSLLEVTPDSPGAEHLATLDPADMLIWCLNKLAEVMTDRKRMKARLMEVADDLRFLARMHVLRMRAFYVDLLQEGQPWTPNSITEQDATRYIRTARARMGALPIGSTREEFRSLMPTFTESGPGVAYARKMERLWFEGGGFQRTLALLRRQSEDGEPAWVTETADLLSTMAGDHAFKRAVTVTKGILAKRRRQPVQAEQPGPGDTAGDS